MPHPRADMCAEDVVRLYNDGHSPQRIIDLLKLACGPKAVRACLLRNGFTKLKPRWNYPARHGHGTAASYKRKCRCTPCVEARRIYILRYTYGVSKDRYEEMLVQQNGLCACCGRPAQRRGRSLENGDGWFV